MFLAVIGVVLWYAIAFNLGLEYESLIRERYRSDLSAPLEWGKASFVAGLISWLAGLCLGCYWDDLWVQAHPRPSYYVSMSAIVFHDIDDRRKRLERMSGHDSGPISPDVG